MSGDYSRLSFDPRRHFAAVLAEQGRVFTDADYNEWVATVLRRGQAEALDTIGWAGVPRETPDGFLIEATGGALTIGQGRIYVDGLLAENHGKVPLEWDRRLAEQRGSDATAYAAQPYLPNPPALPAGAGPHVAYLKVWQREVTYVEDPSLVEPALGVDTTTRLQTVWQVRMLADVGPTVTCATRLQDIPKFVAAEPAADGRLSSDTVEVPGTTNPCQVPPGGGYKGRENQLYRVEIHRGGKVGGNNGARFKWSRDNATVASRVTHINADDELTVESLGRDEVLTFSDGDWVEVIDDWRELGGLPGEMRRIKKGNGVDDATRTITLEKPLPAGMFPVDAQGRTAPERNTRVRRWDQSGRVVDSKGNLLVNLDDASSDGTIPVTAATTSVQLEHGVVVTFDLTTATGTFRTGDWWCMAARTVTGSVEILDTEPPRGPHHHYAKLAIVSFPDGENDCRILFAPLADRFALNYVSGDTQQALPDVTNPAALVPLPHDLVVGVVNGGWPVAGAKVRFVAASGRLAGTGTNVTVTTGASGLAGVAWELDSAKPTQTVEATLLADDGTARGLPVQFSATLARAARVAYQPDKCANLVGTTTVQEALDRLCGIVGGGCDTLSLSPGPDWVGALESLKKGTDATVCFEPGEYVTERPVAIRDLHHIRLKGGGPGTSIVARGAEAAIVLERCASVHLADLSVEVLSFPQKPVTGRMGTVTTLDCERVEIERVKLACPSDATPRAACLTARSGGGDADGGRVVKTSTLVRIRDCELVVGHAQTGVLVVNADRVDVTGCEFHTPALKPSFDVAHLLTDSHRLRKATGQLAEKLVVDREQRVDKAGFNTGLKVGGFVVRLNSPVPEKEWGALVAAKPPTAAEAASARALTGYMQNLMNVAATEPASLPSFGRMVKGLTGRLGSGSRQFLDSPEGRTSVRTMLAGDEIEVKPEAEAAAIRRSVSLIASEGAVRFDSPLSQESWTTALRVMPVTDTSPLGVANHVKAVARRLLQDRAFSSRVAPGVLDRLVARNRASAACGVRVGGTAVGDVTVVGNAFTSTTEAVHGATSFRRSRGFPVRSIRSVRVQGNDIVLSVPFELKEAPHAVFVGNADRIVVSDNRSRVLAGGSMTGIHLEGRFGPHVAVRDNDVRDCRIGVRMVRRSEAPAPRLWVIADNLALGADPVVHAPGEARLEGNVG